MGFIEVLNKYAYKVSFNQSQLYKNIMQDKELFERYHVSLKMKDEFGLIDYEILYRALLNMKSIEDAYDVFIFDNYDILSYLKYDEKVRMFNADLSHILAKLPKFYDRNSEMDIYLPMYETSLNKTIIENYELMQLKHHKEYLNNLRFDIKTVLDLYGEKIYISEFSPLQNVYEDERHICLYFDTLKKLYIIKKDTKTILNEIVLCDHSMDKSIEFEDVRCICDMIENYKYNECLDYLLDKKLISEKTYKKVMKKYK